MRPTRLTHVENSIEGMQDALEASSRPSLRSRFARWGGWFAGWLCVFAALVWWHRDVLDSPPYWDSAMGLFLEADFLVRTGFDYPQLFHEEPRFLRGGAGVYLTSVLPTVLAGMMSALDRPTDVHAAYRLFSIGAAAFVLLSVFAWVRPVGGTLGGVLAATLLATIPPFSVQTELLGMEMPLVATVLIAAWLTCHERYLLAALVSLAAFFVKPNGMLSVMAFLTFVCLKTILLWRSTDGRWRRRHLIGIAASTIALAVERNVTWWLQTLPNYDAITGFFDLERGTRLLVEAAWWTPDVALLFLLVGIASGAFFLTRIEGLAAMSLVRSLREIARDEPILLYSWILLGGILVSHSYTYIIPRYLVFPLVFSAIVLGRVLFRPSLVRPVFLALTVLAIGGNVVNRDGRLYPAIADSMSSDRRTGAILERSREYLVDHASNIAAVQAIVAVADHGPIVAPNPFVHFLTMPSLGYVTKPLRGYAINDVTNTFFEPVETLRQRRDEGFVVVSVENRFTDQATCEVPEFDPRTDTLVYRDALAAPLTVFVPHGEPSSLVADRRALMLRLWPWLSAIEEAEALAKRGAWDEAHSVLLRAMPGSPKDAEVRLALGDLCRKAGRTQEAIEWYQSVPMCREFRAAAMDRLAALLDGVGLSDSAKKARKEAALARSRYREGSSAVAAP